MTDYWIDIDGCQAILNRLDDLMLDKRTYFKDADHHFDDINKFSYAAVESQATNPAATRMDAALCSFFYDKLKPQFESIIETLEINISAMQDAVNYYRSGDAQMEYEAYVAENGVAGVWQTEVRNNGATDVEGPADEGSGTLDGGPYTTAPFEKAQGEHRRGAAD